LDLLQVAAQFRAQHVIRGLVEHKANAGGAEQQQQDNGNRPGEEVRHEQPVSHAPEKLACKRPNQKECQKTEDAEDREGEKKTTENPVPCSLRQKTARNDNREQSQNGLL
jgi:hypothetical protein